MYDDLKDKRVLITGGASGIGYATARRFINEGCRVIILDNDPSALKVARSELPLLAGGLVADVSNPDDIEAAFKQMDEIMGGIDILISNAGISLRKPFTEVDYTQWSKIMRVNLDGMFFCTRAAIERMEPQQSGVILFTNDTHAKSRVHR